MTAADYAKLNTAGKKAFWKQNPLQGDIDVAVPGLRGFKMRCENDDTVVKELYWTRFTGWELASLRLWHGLLRASQPGVVLDIGCYSGIYALISSLEGFQVHAFDIQKRCLERLAENLELNNCQNVDRHLAACADESGEVEFFYYEEEGILSSVASVVPKKVNDRAARVEAVRIDDMRDTFGPVRVVKIDVEGAEQSTLRGMRRTLESSRPDVLIEVNDHGSLGDVKALFPQGYDYYSVDETKPRIRRMRRFSFPFKKARNYLFSTRERKELESFL